MTVIYDPRFDRHRRKKLFDQQSEWLEEQTRKNKCCASVETGNNPHDDFHLCLRKKGHRGYHMDKTTGLNWKWEQIPNEQ